MSPASLLNAIHSVYHLRISTVTASMLFLIVLILAGLGGATARKEARVAAERLGATFIPCDDVVAALREFSTIERNHRKKNILVNLKKRATRNSNKKDSFKTAVGYQGKNKEPERTSVKELKKEKVRN